MLVVLVIIVALIVIGTGVMWYANSKPGIEEIIHDQNAFDLGQWSDPNE
jgi:hypothetical protein